MNIALARLDALEAREAAMRAKYSPTPNREPPLALHPSDPAALGKSPSLTNFGMGFLPGPGETSHLRPIGGRHRFADVIEPRAQEAGGGVAHEDADADSSHTRPYVSRRSGGGGGSTIFGRSSVLPRRSPSPGGGTDAERQQQHAARGVEEEFAARSRRLRQSISSELERLDAQPGAGGGANPMRQSLEHGLSLLPPGSLARARGGSGAADEERAPHESQVPVLSVGLAAVEPAERPASGSTRSLGSRSAGSSSFRPPSRARRADSAFERTRRDLRDGRRQAQAQASVAVDEAAIQFRVRLPASVAEGSRWDVLVTDISDRDRPSQSFRGLGAAAVPGSGSLYAVFSQSGRVDLVPATDLEFCKGSSSCILGHGMRVQAWPASDRSDRGRVCDTVIFFGLAGAALKPNWDTRKWAAAPLPPGAPGARPPNFVGPNVSALKLDAESPLAAILLGSSQATPDAARASSAQPVEAETGAAFSNVVDRSVRKLIPKDDGTQQQQPLGEETASFFQCKGIR